MISCSQGSSGSDASIDEKKRRRMISNRESARRSRMKKQKHLQDLTTEIGRLERERNEIIQSCRSKTQGHLVLRSENAALLAEKTALTNYLNDINSVIGKFKEGRVLEGRFRGSGAVASPQPVSADHDYFQHWRVSHLEHIY